jgi:hypothetical protein
LPLWKNDIEFKRLLSSYIKILPLRKPSDLLSSEICSTILELSEGTIGEISTLLTKVACKAISSGKEYIDLEILKNSGYCSPSEHRRLYESMVHYG